MEKQGIRFADLVTLFQGYLPQGVHNRGDINVIWTAGSAGVTASAKPDILALQEFITLVQGNHA
jgi:hypothetical protein